MKLKDYIKSLIAFGEENPKALEFEVITAKDDEGNGYNSVCYPPEMGEFYGGNEFTSKYDSSDYNAVCVN